MSSRSDSSPQSDQPPTRTPQSTNEGSDGENCSAMEILQRIKVHDLDPKTLGAVERRLCVVHLIGEALSNSEMAHLLKCSDRTIERDRREIRDSHALKPDPKFADRIAGDLYAEAEQAIFRIRRATRDPATTPGDRIAAEKSCFDIRCHMVDRLQSLGYLPSALRRTEVSLRGDPDGPNNFDLNLEINQLVAVVQQDPSLTGLVPDIEKLQALSSNALLAERVADVKQRMVDSSSCPQPIASEPSKPTHA
ncbi:MAG: hypothetical protein JSR52_00850 [Planctomycetes bacterium]|nr:hypothetical protein [Planctomycetota bacterium]